MIVLIDNYDSFTHNLARYFRELDCLVEVVKNDQVTVEQIKTLNPTHLVISPGPCTPNESGISRQAIAEFKQTIPILGVCLGHQTIGEYFGTKLINAPVIKHGKTSKVTVFKQSGLFQSTADEFTVTRYHSLILEHSSFAQSELNITAICEENGMKEVMAFEHQTLPIFGVQFHPESLLTEYGHQMLRNFIKGR